MSNFLKNNAPFSQLISIENIKINELKENEKVHLSSNIIIEHFLVDHRGEYSETCGYRIIGPNKKIIFIPDIDSFDNLNIRKLIFENDLIFLDGTFYSGVEINFRNVKEIPHPFIEDSIKLFDSLLSYEEKSKVYFIHLNHTNPLWDKSSEQYKLLTEKGYKVAEQNQQIFI
jgi:pyrroloquinoline quinone biosynthesis protein B